MFNNTHSQDPKSPIINTGIRIVTIQERDTKDQINKDLLMKITGSDNFYAKKIDLEVIKQSL